LWSEGRGDVLGTPFLVLDWIDGSTDHSLFSSASRSAQDRQALFGEFLEVLVSIHELDWLRADLGFLMSRRGSGAGESTSVPDPAAHHLARIHHEFELVGSSFAMTPEIRQALDWVGVNVPAPGVTCLVHGDFGPHNALVRGRELIALVDWEFATVSDPVQDLGWFTIRGRSRRDNFNQTLLTVGEFIASYTRRTGIEVDPRSLHWWQLYGVLRNVAGRARHENWVLRNGAEEPGPEPNVLPTDEDRRVLAALVETGPMR
jgi:aminoglycoside phosphotransferase (APT) family kinase protein